MAAVQPRWLSLRQQASTRLPSLSCALQHWGIILPLCARPVVFRLFESNTSFRPDGFPSLSVSSAICKQNSAGSSAASVEHEEKGSRSTCDFAISAFTSFFCHAATLRGRGSIVIHNIRSGAKPGIGPNAVSGRGVHFLQFDFRLTGRRCGCSR